MNVIALGWVGVRTDRAEELVHFYADVLGLPLVAQEPGFWKFELPNGDEVEVFGPGDADHDHFTTGPVIGFAVDDLDAAVDELRRHGVELLGTAGPTWQHFRGPDGHVYELVAAGEPRHFTGA
jgi:catechol 2,3-dioxygenase-like lactoylglutathione lyase family enzyme